MEIFKITDLYNKLEKANEFIENGTNDMWSDVIFIEKYMDKIEKTTSKFIDIQIINKLEEERGLLLGIKKDNGGWKCISHQLMLIDEAYEILPYKDDIIDNFTKEVSFRDYVNFNMTFDPIGMAQSLGGIRIFIDNI